MIIVHYMPFIRRSLGGVPAYINLLTRDLGKLCELHIITHEAEDNYHLENCTVHYIQNKWLPWDNSKSEFLELLSELRPDVFHTNACWTPLTALTAIWAKEAGYKVVYTPHGGLSPYSLNRHYWTKKLPAILLYQRKGLQVSDWIHTTSEKEKQELYELGWNRNLYLIPNCVQIDQIILKPSWQRKKNILFISRIHKSKGVHFLIEAVAEMKDCLSDYKVYIVGKKEDGYYDYLVSLTKKKGVEKIVEFMGPIYGVAKWKMYRDADVFVLPTNSENFGIVVPEALASGTPVITTKGAPWQELEINKCGWWIDQGTQSLVSTIKDFLSRSDDEIEEMGRRGRSLVVNKYSSAVIAEQFVQMYKTVIDRL